MAETKIASWPDNPAFEEVQRNIQEMYRETQGNQDKASTAEDESFYAGQMSAYQWVLEQMSASKAKPRR